MTGYEQQFKQTVGRLARTLDVPRPDCRAAAVYSWILGENEGRNVWRGILIAGTTVLTSCIRVARRGAGSPGAVIGGSHRKPPLLLEIDGESSARYFFV